MHNHQQHQINGQYYRPPSTRFKRIFQGICDLIGMVICFTVFGIVYFTLYNHKIRLISPKILIY
ncbi:hypothetical protein BpHYR1_009894 [Brachionus plicatilis]|uniref:Uncharacterized protein n=1 Tax=Brachionus plicatilis TaxID=10195 RepID=A0A3M7QJB4_BRAPC|nr:hypothetical protein BpHYR1_009894 [Brachionus plicatilis]